jgi:hypothetical protein
MQTDWRSVASTLNEVSSLTGDVCATINYRRHNGMRQSNRDADQLKHILPVKTIVRDARRLHTPPTVETMGFALRQQPTGMKRDDFFDDRKVKEHYYRLCEQVIKQETGAAGVKCFHHLVRGNGTSQPFAGIAHCDYSVRTAFDLVSTIHPDGMDCQNFKGRMCVMNVWRNINEASPVRNHHLAMCDGSTVVSPDDFVYYDNYEEGHTSETFHMDPHNHRRHAWYYFSLQTSDEALVFMQYDSDPKSNCRYTFHSSLTVNNGEINFQRESIEVRLVAYFPDPDPAANTMPDMTLPPALRIPAAADAVRTDITHLQSWESGGKVWAKTLAEKGDLSGIVTGLCHHHRKQALRGEFKDLSDADITLVVKEALRDNFIASEVAKHCKITVPPQRQLRT